MLNIYLHVLVLFKVCNFFSSNTVPTPTVSISPNNSYTAGTRVSINCSVLFNSFVDTEVVVNMTWTKIGSGVLIADNKYTYVSLNRTTSSSTSSLLFDPIGFDDIGAYTCAIEIQNMPFSFISPISNISDIVMVTGM